MVTVEEIWKEVLPGGTRLLAGADRLGRGLSRVLVLRPRPPGLDPPQGDELILLSTHALRTLDPDLTLRRTISELASRASAVAVRGEIAADAIGEAERLSLPLFQLPMSSSLPTLERDILRFLSEQRTDWYRRRHAILHDLTALAVQGRGLTAIAHHMAETTGNAVVFEEHGDVIACSLPPAFPERYAEIVRAHIEGRTQHPGSARTSQLQGAQPIPLGEGLARLVAPVMVKDVPAGVASMFGLLETLKEAGLVLEAGATAGAIELAREHAVSETVARIQGDLTSDLIAGTADSQELDRRARRMDYDLAALRVAITFQPAAGEETTAWEIEEALASLGKRLARVLATHQVRAPVHVDQGALTVFYPLEQELNAPALKRLAERLRGALADAVRYPVYVGISRCLAGMEGFGVTFQQARRALELGRALAPDRLVTCFGDLGVYRLLFALRETGEMQGFHEEMLGTLARYDREKNAELIPTLNAFLSSNNATEVAERLSLHRNSLLYRLRRIREISGLDLDDPETRLALHLALRVGETLRAARGAPPDVGLALRRRPATPGLRARPSGT